MGFFFHYSRVANSAVLRRIGPNFERFRDIIVSFLTHKNEEDSIKNEGASELYVAMETRVPIRSSPKQYEAFSLPQ